MVKCGRIYILQTLKNVYNVFMSQKLICMCPYWNSYKPKTYIIDFLLANIHFGYTTFTINVTTTIISIKAL
jgi:hypothetical protein